MRVPFSRPQAGAAGPARACELRVGPKIGKVEEGYCSFCIDLGQIAWPTRFWNPDGSGETYGRPPYDFASARIRSLAKALAPAYLRIGGTEADRALYALDGEPPETPPPPFTSVLSGEQVEAIGAFAQATGLQVAFTLNAGWGARTATGRWDSTQARALMRYTAQRRLPFSVWELGNEPNAWPLFQRNLLVQPEDYAVDLAELARARDDECPGARIAGPSTAYWPNIGEVPTLGLGNITQALRCLLLHEPLGSGAVSGPRALWQNLVPPRLVTRFLPRVLAAAGALTPPDIATWHYYPGLSTRSALAKHRPAAGSVGGAAALAAAAMVAASGGSARGLAWAATLAALATVASACAAIWLVVRPVSASSLRDPAVLDTAARWAEEVNRAARSVAPPRTPSVWLGETGSAQVGGQPGVSGTWAGTLWWLDQLGLLARLHHTVQCRQTLSGSDYGLIDDSTLEPNPDFWASLLWKRLMGTAVHDVLSTPSNLPRHLRVYCHSVAGGRPAGAAAAHTFLAINLGSDAVELDVGGEALREAPEVWVLDAPTPESRTVTINGIRQEAGEDGSVPELRPGERVRRPVVPAGAAAFVAVGAAP